MANEYWGDSLQYLKHIYYHFELVAPGFNTRWLLGTNSPLFSAVERGYIKAFKLDKGKIFRSSLEISVDSHPIWSQYLQSHFSEGSINQLRAELACALSESLDGRWYDRDAENRMLYSSGFGTRMKLRVEHTAQGAVDYVVDSVKELIDIGLVLFEGAKAGCRAYLALRKEIDERGAIAITERMHALGMKIEQSVEQITALIKKGVDILNVILSDPFCQNHILEYFDGLKESISELGYCRMIGGFVGELGLDFIIALATGGQGLVLRAAQLIGGLSSKVLKVMLKLYDTLQEKAAKVLEARMLDLYGEHAFDMLKAPAASIETIQTIQTPVVSKKHSFSEVVPNFHNSANKSGGQAGIPPTPDNTEIKQIEQANGQTDKISDLSSESNSLVAYNTSVDNLNSSSERQFNNSQAQFGKSTTKNYKQTFFDANPSTEGKVVVHHAVEQQVLKRYPGVVNESEIHSLENLRGIPKEINSDIHLSKIRKEWNKFYRLNPSPTKEQLLEKATAIDNKFGKQFNPPVRD